MNKKALILDLDDVLYPEKDYLLQVYYLFAQFLEYTEQLPASPVVAFMKHYLEENGSQNIFNATALKFNIPQKYADNFVQLHKTARLPLKLLLFKEMLDRMKAADAEGMQIVLLVKGDPEMQLNKIRQIEWNGLEPYIKVYFLQELKMTKEEALNHLSGILGIAVQDMEL